METLHSLDIVGIFILASGLAILLVGLSVGDNPFPWESAKPIALMVIGFVLLLAFAGWAEAVFFFRFSRSKKYLILSIHRILS